MNETALVLTVLIIAIGGLAGVAYLLQKRRKGTDPSAPDIPSPGPIGRALFWIVRVLVVLMVLSIISFFVLQSMTFLWVAAILLLAYLVVGRIYQIVLLAGK